MGDCLLWMGEGAEDHANGSVRRGDSAGQVFLTLRDNAPRSTTGRRRRLTRTVTGIQRRGLRPVKRRSNSQPPRPSSSSVDGSGTVESSELTLIVNRPTRESGIIIQLAPASVDR